MKAGVLALFSTMFLFGAAEVKAQTQESNTQAQISTFEAPGAGTNPGQGTVPRSINPVGEITGEYYDSAVAVHGFIRAADGTITHLDVSGASTADGQGTFPRTINPSGVIAGFYNDASHLVTRGFVRDEDGTITTFDGALPMSINPEGETTGTDSGHHGFVRDRNGTITTFDVGPFGTFPQSINPSGEVTGWYADASFITRGFLRDREGKITTFSVGARFTMPASINPSGEIVGIYSDSSSMVHAFVRDRDGKITTFDAGPNTVAGSLNPRGEVIGDYLDITTNLAVGFVRLPDERITTFEVPGAGGPFFGDGTVPQSINPGGEITGFYTDATGSSHGFLRKHGEGEESKNH